VRCWRAVTINSRRRKLISTLCTALFETPACSAIVRETATHRFPPQTLGLTVKVELDQIGGRLTIMTNQVTQENVEDVIIDGDSLVEARHLVNDEKRKPLYR
jgi:hypothetical protein